MEDNSRYAEGVRLAQKQVAYLEAQLKSKKNFIQKLLERAAEEEAKGNLDFCERILQMASRHEEEVGAIIYEIACNR